MQLSNDTVEVLKNFSTINPNLVIEPGQKIQTISESKTVMAKAEIVEDFPNLVGIYDLNEFLSVLNLIDSPSLDFKDKYLTVSGGSSVAQQVQYFYSNPEILTTPQKDINMPDIDVGVTLSEDILAKLKQASSVLGHSDLSLVGKDGSVEAVVLDTKDSTSNTFTLNVQSDNQVTSDFNFDFNIGNLKLIPGDYFVSLSSKKISHWQNLNFPVEYFVALEQSTSFNV